MQLREAKTYLLIGLFISRFAFAQQTQSYINNEQAWNNGIELFDEKKDFRTGYETIYPYFQSLSLLIKKILY